MTADDGGDGDGDDDDDDDDGDDDDGGSVAARGCSILLT